METVEHIIVVLTLFTKNPKTPTFRLSIPKHEYEAHFADCEKMGDPQDRLERVFYYLHDHHDKDFIHEECFKSINRIVYENQEDVAIDIQVSYLHIDNVKETLKTIFVNVAEDDLTNAIDDIVIKYNLSEKQVRELLNQYEYTY